MRGELETGLRKVRADARESLEDMAASIRRLESALDRATHSMGLRESQTTVQADIKSSSEREPGPCSAAQLQSSLFDSEKLTRTIIDKSSTVPASGPVQNELLQESRQTEPLLPVLGRI
jgi:hypothetical protein